jgi:hypothetical protein
MIRDQIKQMILDIIAEVDYDVAKSLDPETAEDPEYAEVELERLIDIVDPYVNAKTNNPPKKKRQ